MALGSHAITKNSVPAATSFASFALLRLKFAQFGEEFSTHDPAAAGPIDTNRSVQFVFIRGFFLIVCGCGYAALLTPVQSLLFASFCQSACLVVAGRLEDYMRKFGKPEMNLANG
jgi:hypothetical protein